MKKIAFLGGIALMSIFALVCVFFMRQPAMAEDGGGENPNDFWFAVLDSAEEKWGSYWFEYYDTEGAFDEINSREVDFVIWTGDCISNPVHPSTATFKFLALRRAAEIYLNAPSYFLAGNHDINSTPTPWARDLWKELVGPLNQEFTHKGAHFVLMSDGDAQFTPMEELYPETVDWYCDTITPDTLSFRHMHMTGSGDPGYLYERHMCEFFGGAQAVFFGHYNQWQDYYIAGTRLIQTPDAKEGNVRFVHVVDGQITEMENFSL